MSSLANISDQELITLQEWKNTLTARQKDVVTVGFSTKFAYHIVRLALEVEQIMIEHHLDVDKNSSILKSIRSGEWPLEKIRSWFDAKEAQLEELYHKSTLRQNPDEDAIRALLMNCIEEHYGSISQVLTSKLNDTNIITEIQKVLDKYSL